MSAVAWLDEAARLAFARAGLRTLEEFADCRVGEPITSARTRWLRRLSLEGTHWYLKVQDLRAVSLPLTRWPSFVFKGSSVTREVATCAILRQHGFRTPDVIAHAKSRGFVFPKLAMLLTREVPGHVDLAAWLARRPAPEAAQLAMDAADGLLRAAHHRGLVLLGAKYRNLLVPQSGPRRPEDFVILDQPDLRESRSARLRRKCQALLDRDRARYGART